MNIKSAINKKIDNLKLQNKKDFEKFFKSLLRNAVLSEHDYIIVTKSDKFYKEVLEFAKKNDWNIEYPVIEKDGIKYIEYKIFFEYNYKDATVSTFMKKMSFKNILKYIGEAINIMFIVGAIEFFISAFLIMLYMVVF